MISIFVNIRGCVANDATFRVTLFIGNWLAFLATGGKFVDLPLLFRKRGEKKEKKDRETSKLEMRSFSVKVEISMNLPINSRTCSMRVSVSGYRTFMPKGFSRGNWRLGTHLRAT